MTNLEIKEVRKILVDELSKYEGVPILLPLEAHILQQLIFDRVLPVSSKEFSTDLKSVLKKIDFSNVPFNDVDLGLCNFDGLNAGGDNGGVITINGGMIKINPKTISERKMIGCNFFGVYFTHNFNGCEIDFSNFEGSTGAVINPQKLKNKSLVGTILSNVTFDGNFDNVRIENANFTGSTGAVINPQMIYDKSLINTVLDSVTFDGFFNNCKIKGANFTGSINAVINPRSVYCRNLTNVNLTDAIVVDNFEGLLLTTNMVMCQDENLIDEDDNNVYEETEKEYAIRMIKSLFNK